MSLDARLDRLESRIGDPAAPYVFVLPHDMDCDTFDLAVGGPPVERRTLDDGEPCVALRVPSHATQHTYKALLTPPQRDLYDRAEHRTIWIRDGGQAGATVLVHDPPMTPEARAEFEAEVARLEAEESGRA